ncbi:hypothetical protein C8R43DRAFT_964242 [Mycena crocata]|nr:hypothetical protein C8R43DRAFT_964242 [Mycena crocata]
MRFLPASLATFLLGVSVLAASDVTGVSRCSLVPFKRHGVQNLQSRSWKRELVPKDSVNLKYGLEMAEFPSTALKFTAHPDTPIVLLEDVDYLVDTVTCHRAPWSSSTEVELNFHSQDAYIDALTSWSSYSPFIIVTSHLTCNLDDRRGVAVSIHHMGPTSILRLLSVTSVEGNKFYPQIRLGVQSIPLLYTLIFFELVPEGIRLAGVSSAWQQPKALDAPFDCVFEFGHVLDLAPRQQLFPLDSSLLHHSMRVLMDNELDDASSDTGVQIFCVNCVSRTNFSVGIELDVSHFGTKIQDSHINITVAQFEHHIQLEVSLDGNASFGKSVDVIRAPLPDLGFNVCRFQNSRSGDIRFFFGGAVNAGVDITGGLNFTVGAKRTVPAGATATFVMAGDTNSSATGCGSLNATTHLSLSPFLDAEITLFEATLAQARLPINTPQLTASAQVQSNVNRQCEPIGTNDFEYFGSALTFGAGASLQIHASTNGSLFPDADLSIFTHPVNFAAIPAPDAPACFIVADDSLSDTATLVGQVPAPTGTLRSAAAAVPTFDIPKIEAFYSANGALSANVNFTQMAQATVIPSALKKAIDGVVNEAGRNHPSPSLFVLLVAILTTVTMRW